VLLLAGQLLFDRAGDHADPYLTLVGYFNATRELAGMARYLADDVQNRVRQPRPGSGFPRRIGSYGQLVTGELTSRIASAEIGRTLDHLALEFDISPVWTMPGAEATVGRLTSEAQRLIDDARMSVVCSSFSFTPNSHMWTALREAAAGCRHRHRYGTCRRWIRSRWPHPAPWLTASRQI
jgi:hypothetical protein